MFLVNSRLCKYLIEVFNKKETINNFSQGHIWLASLCMETTSLSILRPPICSPLQHNVRYRGSAFYCNCSNLALMFIILLQTICTQEWDHPSKIILTFQLLTQLLTTDIHHPIISNLVFESLLWYASSFLPVFLQLSFLAHLAIHKSLRSFIKQIFAEYQILY